MAADRNDGAGLLMWGLGFGPVPDLRSAFTDLPPLILTPSNYDGLAGRFRGQPNYAWMADLEARHR